MLTNEQLENIVKDLMVRVVVLEMEIGKIKDKHPEGGPGFGLRSMINEAGRDVDEMSRY